MSSDQRSDQRFRDLQREYWSQAHPDHDDWRTSHPLIREMERALLAPLAGQLRTSRLLDVGCGEADMLPLLREQGFSGEYLGLDYSLEKACFAQRERGGPDAGFLAGDVEHLPFRDRSIPTVLCRDLLHHVPRRAPALAELLRVAGERLLIIEPNPLAPLIGGLALLRAAERGILRSTPWGMDALLRDAAAGWRVTRLWAEPQSVTRALLHHHFGWPSLGRFGAVQKGLALVEAASRALPDLVWNYQLFVLERG